MNGSILTRTAVLASLPLATACTSGASVPPSEDDAGVPPPTGCTSHAECDDQNACTLDTCQGGFCSNAPGSPCVPPAYCQAPGTPVGRFVHIRPV